MSCKTPVRRTMAPPHAAYVPGRSWLLRGVAAGALAVCVGAAPGGPARAQTAADGAQAGQGGAMVLEAITVSARRRSEQAIDVPVSVTVVDEATLAGERIDGTEDLARHVAGWQQPNYGDDPRTSQPIIRGVGTLSTLLSPDNSTAPTLVDGAPLPAFAASGQLLDIGQAQVLRGPQGTLFGRNSTAGAIVLTSVEPVAETERRVTAEIGSDGYRKGEFVLGGAIAPDLAGRAAVRLARQNDYLSNDHPGQSGIGAYRLGAAKTTLLWRPGDRTRVQLTLSGERHRSDTGYALRLDGRNAYQEQPDFRRDMLYTTLNVAHEFDGFGVRSITNHTYYRFENRADNTDGHLFAAAFGMPLVFFTNDGEVALSSGHENQFYQEFQAHSLQGGPLSWVVGGVLSRNDYAEDSEGTSNFFPTIRGRRHVTLTSTAGAVYGDAAYRFAERFEVGGGLRYTRETKAIDHTFAGAGMGAVSFFGQDTSRAFDMLSARASLSYKPTDRSLVYATVNRGAKAGGYPRFTNNATTGTPESGYGQTTVWAYEAGVKMDLDRRASLTLAAFRNDVKGEAIFVYNAATNTFPIESFDLRTDGAEAELQADLTRGFTMTAGLALTRSTITGAPVSLAATVGNRVPNVPAFTGSVGLQYRTSGEPLGLGGDSELTASVAYRHVSAREADPANTFRLDAQNILDARLGVGIGGVTVYGFGENLLRRTVEQQGSVIAPGVYSVVPSRGRTVGLGLSASF